MSEKVTITRERYEQLVQQSQDAAHVVARNVGTRDLVACGCEQCRRVHEGMLDAELVSGAWPCGSAEDGPGLVTRHGRRPTGEELPWVHADLVMAAYAPEGQAGTVVAGTAAEAQAAAERRAGAESESA